MRSRDVLLLIAAVVLVGTAQLCILPPFEGFDETAHYSYIREIADTGAIPIFGRSTIAADVAEYKKIGPMPYSSVVPFNQNGGWTYQTFAADARTRDTYQRILRTSPPTPRRYHTTSELNWEAQHPPLYYALLAPIMRATDGLPFTTQLFLLRLGSYALAVFGLLIALYGTLEHLRADARTTRALIAGALLYPFLVPMFFPEFGRLGNDSLCTLLVGVTWTCLLTVVRKPLDRRGAIWLGVALGLGLLTKAFFLAIGAGAIAYLAYRSLRSTDRMVAGLQRRQAIIAGAIALVAGGWWYAYKFLAFHSFTGGAELITLDAQGGLIANLQQKFAFRYFARAFVALIASGYYTGTWSLARMPEILYVPGLVLLGMIVVRAVWHLRRVPLSQPEWAALWMSFPVFAGFMYFILARIALTESGNNIGGWYFNVLAPAIAVPIGLGWRDLLRTRTQRWIIGALAAYELWFVVAGQWAEAALYAGCAIKTAESKYYLFPDHWYCLTRIGDVARTLTVIGWPLQAALCLLLGLVCLLGGVAGLLSNRHPSTARAALSR